MKNDIFYFLIGKKWKFHKYKWCIFIFMHFHDVVCSSSYWSEEAVVPWQIHINLFSEATCK